MPLLREAFNLLYSFMHTFRSKPNILFNLYMQEDCVYAFALSASYLLF